MWNSLTGEITHKGSDSLYLLVADVEWDLTVSRNTLSALPAVGSRSKVYTWLQHTEDAMRVFGFVSTQERSLFLDLIKVSGVGPKLAIRCLSGLTWNLFADALEAGDAQKLSTIPGLGIKTAQKIILSLKGKLLLNQETSVISVNSDLVNALVEMGFDRKSCERVVEKITEDAEFSSLSDAERERRLFQKALLMLSAGE
ncbi:MAG: Holliday junction branch migration protein RuvA [Spirochaetales bacterium]|nr:Holliday junction branch migration protein RuvA [Spirochaetales bacterium]